MEDKLKAEKVITNFLEDDKKKILLVKGYDADTKLKVVLGCLNKKFKIGVIKSNGISNISSLINRSFEYELLPSQVKSTKFYELGNMKVVLSSYGTHTKINPKGNGNSFTLYYPVQSVLDNPKKYQKFLSELKDNMSSKVIIITTNEWSIKNFDIENHVDEVFFYDVERDNPQLMKNLRNNGAFK